MRIALSSSLVVLVSLVALALGACNNETIVYHHSAAAQDPLDTTVGDDAGTTPAHQDASSAQPPQDSDPEPPISPTFPQMSLQGGSVLAAPKFQLVRYASDKNTAPANALLQKMGASSYWKDVTSEYGVAPATSLSEVVISTAPPTKWDDTDIKAWLASQLDTKNTVGLAPSDGNTVYVLAFPASSTITLKTDASCSAFLGYHEAVTRANGQTVAYVILPYCVSGQGVVADQAWYTTALSHEMVELVTDPQPFTGYSLGNDHLAWTYFTGGEAGDLCDHLPDQFVQPADLGGAIVQRTWSNRAAAAGHEPCVPAAGAVTFGAFADERDAIEGYDAIKVAKNGRTIHVRLYSDGPTPEFTVNAVDYALYLGGKPELKLTFANGSSSFTGKNGDLVDLTILPIAKGTMDFGTSVFLLDAVSADNSSEHVWPVLVAH